MAERLFSSADVAAKLNRSICMWDGKPIYVTVGGLTNPDHVTAKFLEDSRLATLDYTDDRFSYDEIALGFINADNMATFAYVTPLRHSRLGLRIENISFKNGRDRVSNNNILSDRALHNCIVGNYPNFDEALTSLKRLRVGSAIAISRTMCLSKINKSACRIISITTPVGYVDLVTRQTTSVPGINEKMFAKLLRTNGVIQ